MITIWHNPRCSKSRQALALLEARGDEVAVRRYLDDAPDTDQIRAALATLDIPAIALVRRGEKAWKESGLTTDSAEDDIIAAMAAHPILIERPVVFANARAVIARPPEKVAEIL